MEKVKAIQTVLDSMAEDLLKFEKGNKASALRLRKSLQEIKKLAQEARIEIQEKKNNS